MFNNTLMFTNTQLGVSNDLILQGRSAYTVEETAECLSWVANNRPNGDWYCEWFFVLK